jgi:hypothetical protein
MPVSVRRSALAMSSSESWWLTPPAVNSNEVCTWAMTSTGYLDAIGPEAETALPHAFGTPGVQQVHGRFRRLLQAHQCWSESKWVIDRLPQQSLFEVKASLAVSFRLFQR